MISVSEAELVAVVKKVAEPDTERRVLAAALHDPVIQQRLERLQQPSAPSDIEELLQRVTLSIVREYAQSKTPWWQPFVGQLRQRLVLSPRPLRLPLLASALAAPAEGLLVQRDTFVQEGVHVELHQLPGTSRLRVLVDASRALEPAVNAVALAFQEAAREPFVVTIHLNSDQQGRGEWEVGGSEDTGFPAPTGALVLIEVALLELA